MQENIEITKLFKDNLKSVYICFTIPFVLAIILSLLISNQYTTSATLAPKRSSVSNSSNGVGILAAFSGIEDDKLSPELKFASNYFLSYKFLSTFIIDNDLIDDILMFKGFDPILKKNILHKNSSALEVKNLFSSDDPLKGLKETQEATKEFRRYIKFYASRSDPSLAVVEVTHYSPDFSYFLATNLLQKLDDDIAAIDRASSQSQIAYINSILPNESSIDTSKVLSSLLSREYTKKILASSSDQYAFALLDPPVYPIEKSKPRRSIYMLVSILTGFMLSITLLAIKYLIINKPLDKNHDSV